MTKLPADELKRQELYRDARFKNQYDDIWQSVNKCVFCDLNEKYIFFEENGIVMTISLYAYIDGHFMIVPRQHVRSAKELSQTEWDTIRKFMYIAKKLIRQVHHVRGMQFIQKDGIAAQSTVEHIHFHCIPFDTPDLCQWNYRQLTYTPLQNVALYKKQAKSILKYDLKFTQKYHNRAALPLVCDLIVVNQKNEVLIQERKKGVRLSPDYLTILGGHVDDFSVPFETELAREVQEETGWRPNIKAMELLSSRIGNISHEKISKHLRARYAQPSTFVWNTYIIRGIDDKTAMRPGSDSKRLLWMPVRQAITHPRLTKEVKEIIQTAAAKYGLINHTTS